MKRYIYVCKFCACELHYIVKMEPTENDCADRNKTVKISNKTEHFNFKRKLLKRMLSNGFMFTKISISLVLCTYMKLDPINALQHLLSFSFLAFCLPIH